MLFLHAGTHLAAASLFRDEKSRRLALGAVSSGTAVYISFEAALAVWRAWSDDRPRKGLWWKLEPIPEDDTRSRTGNIVSYLAADALVNGIVLRNGFDASMWAHHGLCAAALSFLTKKVPGNPVITLSLTGEVLAATYMLVELCRLVPGLEHLQERVRRLRLLLLSLRIVLLWVPAVVWAASLFQERQQSRNGRGSGCDGEKHVKNLTPSPTDEGTTPISALLAIAAVGFGMTTIDGSWLCRMIKSESKTKTKTKTHDQL
jgi:hypothetical protein